MILSDLHRYHKLCLSSLLSSTFENSFCLFSLLISHICIEYAANELFVTIFLVLFCLSECVLKQRCISILPTLIRTSVFLSTKNVTSHEWIALRTMCSCHSNETKDEFQCKCAWEWDRWILMRMLELEKNEIFFFEQYQLSFRMHGSFFVFTIY